MTLPSFRLHPVPAAIVAGFSLVFAVNGLMIWLAVSSFSGLYSGHARDRGVHYNSIVADQKARDALGWHADVTWAAETKTIRVAVTESDNRPLVGATASISLIRPAEKRTAIEVPLIDLGTGVYAAVIDLPARGNWDADLTIQANGRRFVITKRLFLK